MALYNEIQVGRFNRFIQKLLSIKGGPPMPTVASDLQIGLDINSGAENRYLEGWDLFGNLFTVAAFAGNVAVLGLRNPVGSNVVAVVTKAIVTTAIANNPALTLFPLGSAGALVDQTNARTARGLDPRGRPASTCVLTDSSGVATVAQAGGIVIDQAQMPITSRVEFMQLLELPLLPGTSIALTSTVVNQAAQFGFWWRERYLEDSERS